jgi:hypothetical protein
MATEALVYYKEEIEKLEQKMRDAETRKNLQPKPSKR